MEEELDGREKFESFLESVKSSDVQKSLISLFCRFIDVSFTAGSVFCPALGSVHSIVKMFYPNYSQEEIMKNFVDLKRMINKMNNKMMETSVEERWNHIKTRFLDDIESLESAIQITSLALKAEKEEFAKNWMEELMDRGRGLMRPLNHLLDGVAGEESQCEFDDQILISFYNYTGGDKRKIERFCLYLDQLLLNGLASLCVYLTFRKGIEWCHEVVESLNFEQRLSRSVGNMMVVLERCEKECTINMRKDAKEILMKETGDVQSSLLKISEIYFKKYYWMETFFIFYKLIGRNSQVNPKDVLSDKTAAASVHSTDECDGQDCDYAISEGGIIEHFDSGSDKEKVDEVDFSNQDDNKRFVLLIFARRKPVEETCLSKLEATRVAEDSISLNRNSRTAFRKIKNELDSKGIAYWGLAVMKHAGHLWTSRASIFKSGSNETCDVVWVVKKSCTVCILLGDGDSQPQILEQSN